MRKITGHGNLLPGQDDVVRLVKYCSKHANQGWISEGSKNISYLVVINTNQSRTGDRYSRRHQEHGDVETSNRDGDLFLKMSGDLT